MEGFLWGQNAKRRQHESSPAADVANPVLQTRLADRPLFVQGAHWAHWVGVQVAHRFVFGWTTTFKVCRRLAESGHEGFGNYHTLDADDVSKSSRPHERGDEKTRRIYDLQYKVYCSKCSFGMSTWAAWAPSKTTQTLNDWQGQSL